VSDAAERQTWWLDTRWLPHRHPIEAVHPLLVRLQEARGASFLTCGHVLAVLGAKDPAGLVGSWLLGAPLSRGLGLPARLCAWREGDETCDRPVRAANAKFCETHAAASARRSKRDWKRARGRRSKPLASPCKAGPGGPSRPPPWYLVCVACWR